MSVRFTSFGSVNVILGFSPATLTVNSFKLSSTGTAIECEPESFE